jgi:hypothetical protein
MIQGTDMRSGIISSRVAVVVGVYARTILSAYFS